MKNILFISYEFPPLNRGGTQRPLKFVKYLREFGVNPIVLTLDPSSYPIVYDQYHVDAQTVQEVQDKAEVVYVPSENIIQKYQGKLRGFLTIYFSLVQREAEGWKPHLLPVIEKIISEKQVAAVVATAPPFSIAPLACEIAKHYHLPLILDFRDAWSQWIMQPYATYLHYQLLLKLEKECLRTASAVVATSDQTIADFKFQHPEVSQEKYHLIPNGFDLDIENWDMEVYGAQEKFMIGYVGSFYYNPVSREKMFTPWWKKKGHHKLEYTPKKEDWLYRSPYFFFTALARLREKDPAVFQKVEVVFAGLVPDWLQEMVESFNLQEQVRLMGRISHQESLSFQRSCDALLLTSSKVIGGEDYSIAGKTFEYLTMKKPVVAFVAKGAQKRLLEQTGIAIICNPDDAESASERLYQLIKNKPVFTPNVSFIRSLHRKALTEKLVNVINNYTESK